MDRSRQPQTARGEWTRALGALPRDEVMALAARVSRGCEVRLRAPVQAGLAMLRLRDGALGEVFNLGEIPLARAHVFVQAQGAGAEGAASVMDGDGDYARALAILDAVAAGGLPGADEVSDLHARGAVARQAAEETRRAVLAATRVDFSLLSATAEEDDDA